MKSVQNTLWQINAIVPKSVLDLLEGVFYSCGAGVAVLINEIEDGKEKELYSLEVVCEGKEELDRILNLISLCGLADFKYEVKEIENKNWLEESFTPLPPIKAGRYYVYGSHIKEEIPPSLIPLKIDTKTAFGSGKHQTTKGCLLALNDLAKDKSFRPKNALDMGCGSGILALAAVKTFHIPVLAVDIDAESVRVAKKVASDNRLAKYLRVEVGNGYLKGSVAKKKKYDLIFANILAKPLIKMAKDLKKHLAENGVAVLSGLLSSQEEWVLNMHRLLGLSLKRKYRVGEWSTLIVGKT